MAPLPDNALPYGVRDIKVTPITADVAAAITYGTMVDLPASQTLSWSETEDFEQLRGDDTVVAERGNGPLIDWTLEQGGISLNAYKVIVGGTTTASGTTPNQKVTHAKLGTDARPYFRVDGQAINDNGGDTKVTLYRCKATGKIDGSFENGKFKTTAISGTGYPNADNKLYDTVQGETAAAIIQPV